MAETLKIASQGKGTPLVFIHGWGLNSGVWQPLKTQLIDHFQVITVDLPGFGVNVKNELQDYSLANIVAEIGRVIEQPAVYIGWSLGGLIATEIAYQHPEKVLALVTVASSPLFVESEDWPGIKPELLKGFHQQLAQDTQKTIDGFLKIQAMGSPNIRHDIKQLRALIMEYPMPTKNTLDQSLQLLETIDLREKLSELRLPFLRLYGRLDSLIPKTIPALVTTLAPHSEQYIFAKASHAPFISHPEEFLQIIESWLKTAVS
ncbi:pimeloyl-ACP methyl ester esterase BioH [Colwelliaceae bacterium 6471]